MKKKATTLAVIALLVIAAVPTIAFANAQLALPSTESLEVQKAAASVSATVPAATQELVGAVSAPSAPAPASAPPCTGFTDTDNDGVCDNYAAGVCTGHGRGNGAGYVDADGDGVCDNYESGVQGCGQGSGRGQGAGFTDADGNGVCDNYDADTCPGNGSGRGFGWGAGAGHGHHGRGC